MGYCFYFFLISEVGFEDCTLSLMVFFFLFSFLISNFAHLQGRTAGKKLSELALDLINLQMEQGLLR